VQVSVNRESETVCVRSLPLYITQASGEIVDTSAIIAVLFNEDDAEIYAKAMTRADVCRISAATFVETAIVVEAQTKNNGGRQLDALIRRAGIALNYGDCFSYALSKATREPLLFKGKGFAKTDLTAAL
jgi:ribonuclease VapC